MQHTCECTNTGKHTEKFSAEYKINSASAGDIYSSQ